MPGLAQAACIDPTGEVAAVIYNEDTKTTQYCDGDNWIAMHGAGSGSGGCATATIGTTPEGFVFYNKDHRTLQACAGSVWKAIGRVGGLGGPDVGVCTDPDRPEGALTYSSAYHVYQYCDGANWVPVGKLIDNAPDAFGFIAATDVALSTIIESNIVLVTGITAATVAVSGDGSPEFRVCNDAACGDIDHAWGSVTSAIDSGQFLQLRLTSNAAFSTPNSAIVTVGTASDQWDVTTVAQDTAPDAFSFTDATVQPLNTLITSNSVTITDITGTVNVSVSGAGSPQISIAGGAWITSGTITNGQTLQVRLTSANADSTMRSATVTVGGVSDQWDVTTQDTTPDAFSFTDVTAQPLNTLTASNSVAISGITGSIGVSVSGAGSPQISIAGGAWVTSGTITNGQTLQARLTSANSLGTLRSATVTAGTVSDQWDVTSDVIGPFTEHTPGLAGTRNSIAYGAGLFVAVGSSTSRVATSPDGVTWTSRTAPGSTYYAVTYAAGQFVAVGVSGIVMTSPDGITWTARTVIDATSLWLGVTYGGGLYVAVSNAGTRVMTSPDGINWTARAVPEANPWNDIAYGGGQFVAVATTGTNQVMTSPNGITWTARTAAAVSQWRDVAHANGLFVAVANSGTDQVMTSPDGINWTVQVAPAPAWNDVTFGDGLFLVVRGAQAITSPDGITWTWRALPAGAWTAVTYGNGKFVAVNQSGAMTSLTADCCGP